MPHNSTHTYIVLLHRFHRPENTPCRSFEPTSVTSIYDPCTSCDQYHILSYPTKQPASTTQRTRLQYHSWSCWVFFFSNRHNQPAMGFKLILNAHRTYFTPQAMRYAFTRYVCTCVCVCKSVSTDQSTYARQPLQLLTS